MSYTYCCSICLFWLLVVLFLQNVLLCDLKSYYGFRLANINAFTADIFAACHRAFFMFCSVWVVSCVHSSSIATFPKWWCIAMCVFFCVFECFFCVEFFFVIFVTSEFCFDTAHAQRLNCVMLTQLKRVIQNKLRLSINSFLLCLNCVLLTQLKRNAWVMSCWHSSSVKLLSCIRLFEIEEYTWHLIDT